MTTRTLPTSLRSERYPTTYEIIHVPPPPVFDLPAALESLAILQRARTAAYAEPNCVWTLLSHAIFRLDREVQTYLRGDQ